MKYFILETQNPPTAFHIPPTKPNKVWNHYLFVYYEPMQKNNPFWEKSKDPRERDRKRHNIITSGHNVDLAAGQRMQSAQTKICILQINN